MVRRPTPVTKRPADLSPEQMIAGIERLTKRLEEVRKFEPTSVTEQFNIPHVERLSAAIDETLVRTFGADSADFDRYRVASQFDNGPFNYAYQVNIAEVQRSLARSKDRNIALIEQAIEALKERLAEVVSPSHSEQPSRPESSGEGRKVFVVHGHSGVEQGVARFLEQIGFEPIILHEQPNQGKTLIEKFKAHSDVGFAVVLLTDDDLGGPKGGEQNPRARQNVVLELGYFIGRLGRDRVCALKNGNIELPSDILGIVWEDLDDQGGWRAKLARELQAAKYEIDWNAVMRS
jgi:predicted nucleotide-binding protein